MPPPSRGFHGRGIIKAMDAGRIVSCSLSKWPGAAQSSEPSASAWREQLGYCCSSGLAVRDRELLAPLCFQPAEPRSVVCGDTEVLGMQVPGISYAPRAMQTLEQPPARQCRPGAEPCPPAADILRPGCLGQLQHTADYIPRCCIRLSGAGPRPIASTRQQQLNVGSWCVASPQVFAA